VKNLLVLVLLALGVAAAAVAASVLLVGSTRGNDRVGNLSPVASIAPAPTPPTSVPARTVDGEDEDD